MKRACLILTILLMAATSYAGVIQDGSITVSAAAQGFADVAAIPNNANGALLRVEGDDVRIGFKTTPTAAIGAVLSDGDSLSIGNGHDVNSFRVILKTGSTTTKVWYMIFD